MQMRDFLRPENILLDVNAQSKVLAIRQAATVASEKTAIAAPVIAKALMDREGLGSTGIGNGIALPHAGMAELTEPLCLAMRLAHPIDFEAVDDNPVDLVFVILTPAETRREALNILSCVARSLRDERFVAGLRQARSSDEFSVLITQLPDLCANP